ncbi:hypothetical protein PIB30_097633, partial [Stylosanthes scabra]|nr:hypothetical protein [Stylosanthes scabra]
SVLRDLHQGTEGTHNPQDSQEPQVEIPLSQSAPPIVDPIERPILNLPTPPAPLSTPSFNPMNRPFRPKQRIFKAPTTSLNTEVPPEPAPQVAQPPNPSNPDAISAETLAAASGTTASRLFRHIPTPGFKAPNQDAINEG